MTANGEPTPRRALWLATTRYLSGGALGMHALSLYLMAQLGPGQSASARPDLFTAYSRMTPEGFRKDLAFRYNRTMTLTPWQRGQFDAALDALCNSDVRVYLFFPPDHFAVTARYMANDGAGLLAFKRTALTDIKRHNARCRGKVTLFDFLYRNAITEEDIGADGSRTYVDLIHFRPPIGLRLLRRMLGGKDIGIDMTSAKDADAETDRLRDDAVNWSRTHGSARPSAGHNIGQGQD